MNKVKIQFTTLLLIVIMTGYLGCGNKPAEKETESDQKDRLESYQLDLYQEKKPLVELIESLEITRIEETEESLLRRVYQMEFYEDKMIIPTNSNDGTIYIFSARGEYLSKFNRKGNGPEEYSRWTDIWLEDDLVCIYVRGKSIKRYDFDGNFISQDRLEEWAEHVYPYKSGYALDMHMQFTQDSLKYSIVTIDDQMKINQTYIPFEKVSGLRNPQFRNSFFTLDEDLFYLRSMIDTVYRFTENGLVPFIHYDFQEDWYFKPNVELKPGFNEESYRNKQVWFVLNFVGKRHIYLYTTLGPRMDYSFLIDRKSKQIVNINKVTTDAKALNFQELGWKGDRFLISMSPNELADLLEQLDQQQYSFNVGTTLEAILSSENPVLVAVTFIPIG